MAQPVAIDTETALIRPAQMAPRLVCLTAKRRGAAPTLHIADGAKAQLDEVFRAGDVLVGHNVAFDLGVACAAHPSLIAPVFGAYEADRIADTMIRQWLLDTAAGKYRGHIDEKGRWKGRGYSLEELAWRCAGIRLKKTGFRLFYGLFDGVPVDRWDAHAIDVQARASAYLDGEPDAELDEARALIGEKRWRAELDGLIAADPSEARTYALADAEATLAIYEAQEQHRRYLEDQHRQAYAYWVLHLSSCWGLRTDGPAVEALRADIEAHYRELEAELMAVGLVRQDGTRDTKRAKRIMVEVCRRDGLEIRRTDGHVGDGAKCKDIDGQPLPAGDAACAEHVCLDADACNATEDPILVAYAELTTDKKILSNDIEALLKGTTLPVHPSYGFAETGRTTCRGPNIQNQSKREGIRECFVPRPGKVFAQCDYPQLELYTLAQCCVSWLGQSKLAEALNAGVDPHLKFAARVAGVEYAQAEALLDADDERINTLRKFGKVFNFGKPGGLGIPKLVTYAKKVFKLDLSEAYARELNAEWYATWPEMLHYFARVNALCDTPDGKAVVETLFTRRVRGGASYCAACNNGFQALGSDCAKSACRNIGRRLYVEQGSALYGSRLVAFVHDEFIVETDDGDRAHDAAYALAEAMSEGANVYLPDVPIPVERLKPVLMRRWSKRAKQVFKEGRLIAWQ